MGALLSVILLAISSQQEPKSATSTEKRELAELLPQLPHSGEFLTEEGIDKASDYVHALLGLTEKDIEKYLGITPKDIQSGKYDLYPLLAVSRGLLDRKKHRLYGVKYFDQ